MMFPGCFLIVRAVEEACAGAHPFQDIRLAPALPSMV